MCSYTLRLRMQVRNTPSIEEILEEPPRENAAARAVEKEEGWGRKASSKPGGFPLRIADNMLERIRVTKDHKRCDVVEQGWTRQ